MKALLAERDATLEDCRESIGKRDTELARFEGLDDRFKTLAAEVFDESTKRFLVQAKQAFKGEQKESAAQLDLRKQAIETMLRPIRESLKQHADAVKEVEKNREGVLIKAFGS